MNSFASFSPAKSNKEANNFGPGRAQALEILLEVVNTR